MSSDDNFVTQTLHLQDWPIYWYSVYGPRKEEPNLVDGMDYLSEELRLQYYIIMGTSQKQQKQQSSFEIFGSSGGAFGQPQPQRFGTPQNTFEASNTNQPSMFGTPTFGQNTIRFPETQKGFGTSIGGISFDQNVASFGVSTQQTIEGFRQIA
ncbi:hypothetical protein C2G38_2163374 [Gigaspora rosea]|uniref:Uncharacterized protein n=1 Tax=Gigaspora rosea TaxID=44941 RepID=A0A397VZI2_9GLOM|nr:hypothetical protein C2G38_2163374 [Gigaspora rosea]